LKFARKVDLSIIGFLGLALGLTIYAYESRIVARSMDQTVSAQQIVTPGADMAHGSEQGGGSNEPSEKYLLVGNLVDFTGTTATSGQAYGQAIIDAANWINESGGINGKLIDLDTVETSYLVRRALAAYRKWQVQGVVAIQGWGTQIGQAMTEPVSRDQVPFFSASYAATFTDPTHAPYNFFYGPSYSDGCRGLVLWAADDWSRRGENRRPVYIHMGDNHPYPNAPKKACETYAEELGFDIQPSIEFSLVPEDFTRQCRRLQASGADYAFLANTDNSVAKLLEDCHEVGTRTQFMANIWGYDERVMQAIGGAANGVVWVMGAARWGDEVPGMYTVQEISRMSDPEERKYRSVHYIRGICSMFYLMEAMEWADVNGGINGQNIRLGMYQRSETEPAGLEGVCLPGKWVETDHRGINQVLVYQGRVNGATNGSLEELIERGIIRLDWVFTAEIPRRPEWLGI
jgi:branched-chain amino acid transport system substrate-binding protein